MLMVAVIEEDGGLFCCCRKLHTPDLSPEGMRCHRSRIISLILPNSLHLSQISLILDLGEK